jgi:CheY-like chemotaxis protein
MDRAGRRGGDLAIMNGLALLAVEDQPANVALLRALLARSPQPALRDAVLDVAGTLADGHAALERRRYDVVLLDIRLPDGDGLDIARAHASRPDRPRFLVLTANALPGDEEGALAAGADMFMAKPYEPSALAANILRLAGLDGDGPLRA